MVVLCWRAFLVEHRHWINQLMEFQLEFLLDHMLVRAFLVEHRHWINPLMEFQLEFLLDHMLVISFWYVLLVEPFSCNLHEGTLVI